MDLFFLRGKKEWASGLRGKEKSDLKAAAKKKEQQDTVGCGVASPLSRNAARTPCMFFRRYAKEGCVHIYIYI